MSEPQFEAVDGKPNWSRMVLEETDNEALQGLARRMNRTREKGVYYVCGLLRDDEVDLERVASETQEIYIMHQRGHQLYRVKTENPLEIVEACKVGEQGEYYGSSPEKVREELAKLHAKNPIVPYFADSAGFQCEFENPITDEFGRYVGETLTDGLEVYAEEEEGDFGDWLRRDGNLRLWWD